MKEIVFASNKIKISSLSDAVIKDYIKTKIVAYSSSLILNKPVLKKMMIRIGSNETCKKMLPCGTKFDINDQMCGFSIYSKQKLVKVINWINAINIQLCLKSI